VNGAPPLAVRRVAVTPAVVAVELALVIASPLILALAAAASLLDARRRRPWRLALLVCGYCALELIATAGGVVLWLRRADGDASYALVGRFLQRVRRLAEATTGFEMQIESDSREAQEFLAARAAPALVLSRHAGAGDSFLIVQELLCRYGRHPRIVMKAALQLDPLIDMFGNRVPNCFIGPGREHAEKAIETLAGGLDAHEALLIFPEGGNFSLARRRRGIARLVRAGERDAARSAMRMHHVTAPNPGGVLAALDASPGAGVVVVGHTGLADAESTGAFWRSVPFRSPARMRLWLIERSQIPDGEDERADWLFEWWDRVDDWIGAGGVE
jgi:1-acyl-sn-glycerol-3-phosphate acyltransferase